MSQDESNSVQPSRSRRTLRIAMFVVLAVLLALLASPLVAYRIGLAWGEGQSEAARRELRKVDLLEFARASRQVAKAVAPSVVSVNTIHATTDESTADERQHYSGPRAGQQYTGQGSGVIVDEEGYILTNFHVVAGASRIEVHLSNATSCVAEPIGVDDEMDLALLKVDRAGAKPIVWGSSKDMEVGDPVWAIGSPFGLENTVTFGIISGKGRRNVDGGSQVFLQTNAAINPGNSGGPLVNIQGELVGINTAILATPNTGIGFAIPSDAARKAYERLKRERPARPLNNGYLGVKLRGLTQELVDQLQLRPDQEGALVAGVAPGSPAAEAGFQPGDLITSINGRSVEDPTRLSLQIAATPPGRAVVIDVLRAGATQTIRATIGERPKPKKK